MPRKNRIFLPADELCPPAAVPPPIPTGNIPVGALVKRDGRFSMERNRGQIKITRKNMHLMDKGAGMRWLIFEQRGCVKCFLAGSSNQRTAFELFDYYAHAA